MMTRYEGPCNYTNITCITVEHRTLNTFQINLYIIHLITDFDIQLGIQVLNICLHNF